MSAHYCKEYDDNCEGCQPAIADAKTGAVMPKDSPTMRAVLAYWKTVPLDHKQACHRVWCHNSRDMADLEMLATVAEGMEASMHTTN